MGNDATSTTTMRSIISVLSSFGLSASISSFKRTSDLPVKTFIVKIEAVASAAGWTTDPEKVQYAKIKLEGEALAYMISHPT